METSDERRKVASALRGNPNDTLIPQSRDGFEGMTYHEAAWRFWNMCRRVRGAANADIAYSTTSVLADLIDPTCHQVLEDETQVCSECGGDLDERYGWDYCPCCGARITEVS